MSADAAAPRPAREGLTFLPDYAAVFDALPLPATLIDSAGLIVDVNQAFFAMARRHGIHIRKEDRVGRPIWQFAGEDDPELGRRAVAAYLAGHEPPPVRRVERDRFGREGLHDLHVRVLRDTAGQVTGALVAREEVTEVVRQSVQLEETSRLLSTFRTVGHLVLSTLDLDAILETIAREVVKAGIFRSLTVALVDEEAHAVEVVRGFVRVLDAQGRVVPGAALRADEDIVGLHYDLGDRSIMAEVARTGLLQVTAGDDDRFDPRVPRIPDEAPKVCYFMPVKKGDRTLAVLATASEPDARDATLRLIEAMGPLLDQVAIALEHARLYRQTQRNEQEARVRLAVQQVRNEILLMQRDSDWSRVVAALRRQLHSLVAYDGCGINLVHVDGHVTSYSTGRAVSDLYEDPELPRPLDLALRTGKPVYRHNRQEMEASGDRPNLLAGGIQSVVDVPFSTGTLAMNSVLPDAFTQADIAVLESFASVMSEGHRRLEDLRALAAKERQLQQAQKMEAVGQLTAGIAHNFNNMLQAITGNLELARFEAPPSVAALIGNALETSDRAAEMVRQLLVYSRQGQRPAFSPVDVSAVLASIQAICRRTFDRKIQLDLRVEHTLPPVLGDSMQLEQVVLNLCINARDALEEGQTPAPAIALEAAAAVTLAAGSVPAEAKPGLYLRLRVRDNGPGMDEETRKRIFEPFFTTKDVDKGTGLGLSTALGIAQDHGGWIECDTRLGEGTQFDLYLPAAPNLAPQQEEARPMSDLSGSETILVIDDEEMVRGTAVQMLQRRGYAALSAGDGEEGLAVFRQHRDEIDLVLLDHSMPRLSGLEVLARLRQESPRVPIVIITGFPAGLEEFEGADDLIQKPFSLDSLVGRVRDVLDRA